MKKDATVNAMLARLERRGAEVLRLRKQLREESAGRRKCAVECAVEHVKATELRGQLSALVDGIREIVTGFSDVKMPDPNDYEGLVQAVREVLIRYGLGFNLKGAVRVLEEQVKSLPPLPQEGEPRAQDTPLLDPWRMAREQR